jgi:hypothetical protein
MKKRSANPLDGELFVWHKVDAGYEIKDGFIVERPDSTELIRYEDALTSNPPLFSIFSDLDAEADILEFANNHGLLLGRTMDLESDTPTLSREKVAFWQHQIHRMRDLMEIWQWSMGGELAKLSQVITWPAPDRIWVKLSDLSWGTTAQKHPVMFEEFHYGDLILPAKFFVQQQINDKLKEYPVLPRLLFDEANNLQQYFYPSSLLAGLWYQAFQFFSSEIKIDRCRICGQWEDVSDKNVNWTSHAACVQRDAKIKNRKFPKVKDLIRQGVPVADISKELHVDERAINRWLTMEAERTDNQRK